MAGRNFHPHIREARKERTAGKPRSANEWAQQTRDLRARLGISQSELARLLDCSAMTVSRWEKGRVAPSAHYDIELGKLAGKPDCWFYWEKAGLQSSDVVRVLPERERKQLPVNREPGIERAEAGPAAKMVQFRCYRRLPERTEARATSEAV
jgi:transcriptional regulator with XRE-family HTH domain